MKHTEEEMAEAALLLAHTDTSKAMPAELESTILDRARVVAQDVRFSTTKAGAVELDAPLAPVIPLRPASRVGAWMGWTAAAACLAFAVYEWRTHSAGPSIHANQPVAAAPNRLLDAGGQPVAELTLDRDGSLRFKVLHLPAKPGQRYQLWMTSSDPTHATAAGSFACEPPGCDGRELSVTGTGVRPNWAWITTVNGTEARPPTDSAAIVGSGGIAAGP